MRYCANMLSIGILKIWAKALSANYVHMLSSMSSASQTERTAVQSLLPNSREANWLNKFTTLMSTVRGNPKYQTSPSNAQSTNSFVFVLFFSTKSRKIKNTPKWDT
uniref:Uncharacterized protein n=1 Tax=Sphaerodactylus townsendi TaxID=933632 RepID=A0ACB8EHQ0_9SAUR